MSASVSYPIQVLREHLTELEAAMSVCLGDPGHKPVHKLRTETRRVEALLLLVDLVPGMPEHRKEATALLRALAKLRRAAGEVRDFDVQRKMLEQFADERTGTAEEDPVPAADKPAKGNSRKGDDAKQRKVAVAQDNAATKAAATAAHLSKSALELRKHMGHEREKAAAALQDLLERRQAKTAKAAESLLEVLQPAEELSLPAPDLLRNAESVLTRDGLLAGKDPSVAALGENDLHTVRKAAKAARYVAEALGDDPSLAEAARDYEALQESGGQWHDALELARAARRHFGKGHELTAAYREQRDQKLEAYRSALSARTAGSDSARKRKPASGNKPSARRKSSA